MRYTTVIDITEMQQIYRSQSCRLLYLHMALKAGYHDDDRDIYDRSIRSLAADVNCTVSATRHALKQLEKAGLIKRQDNHWIVKKFVLTEEPTKRARTKREQQEQIIRMERQLQQQQLEQRSQERQEYDVEAAVNSEARKRIMARFGLGTNDKVKEKKESEKKSLK